MPYDTININNINIKWRCKNLKTRKVFKIIALLLMILLCFQITYFTPQETENFDNHVQNNSTSIMQAIVHSGSISINNISRKVSYELLTNNSSIVYQAQISFYSYPLQLFCNNEMVINSRLRIQQVMSNYFHGSKYKSVSLFI